MRTGAVPPPAGYSPEDLRIPTLREVAERFPAVPLGVEIKGDPSGQARLVALAPEVEVSPGAEELAAWFVGGVPLPEHYRILQISPEFRGVDVLSPDLVARAHDEGRAVWVWASDRSQETAETYRRWLEAGVDGVLAGRPAEFTAVRGDAG